MANVVTVNAENAGPLVNGYATWDCGSQKRRLADVLLPVSINSIQDLSLVERDATEGRYPVVLEQPESGSPCVITLCCAPQHPAVLTSLLVVSEARTMEVYTPNGEYCGTARGERDGQNSGSSDQGPFFRKHLVLETVTSSCEVKLLSLGGRGSVAVAAIVTGVRPSDPPPPGPDRPGQAQAGLGPGLGVGLGLGPGLGVGLGLGLGPSIDMQQVQSMVEEMGKGLSPGAQSLMDMVQFQQKNQAASLGGLLPLLMGSGALSALTRSHNGPTATSSHGPQSTAPAASSGPPSSAALPPTGAPPPLENGRHPAADEGDSASSHARPAGGMSPFLTGFSPGPGQGQEVGLSPDLLSMLQSVCGQVTQLRLENAATAAARTASSSGLGEEGQLLEQVMERHLDEMEKRLKDHIDQRLDVLEQKLERVLLSALPLLSLKGHNQDQGGETSTTTTVPLEQNHPT